MSNYAPLTCGILADEQCDLGGVPDDLIMSNQAR
jgi:hypothetical protein